MTATDRDHLESKLAEGPVCGTAARPPQLHDRATSRCRDESGQAVLEICLILPFLCALVLLLVDFGKAMAYWINATQVANEGARYAAVNAPGGTIQSLVNDALFPELKNGSPNVGPNTAATVSICFPTGKKTVGEPVTVKIQSAYRVTVLPFMGTNFTLANIPIKVKATMRLEQNATFSQVGTCP
jgi:Flp pilus assembly protein TadG